MFRIRKITNPYLEGNKHAMERVRKIIRAQFPGINENIIQDIPDQMVNTVKRKYQTSLVIADDFRGNIRGFAIFLYMSDLKFCFLDFLSVNPDRHTSGVGGSIYEKLREEAASLKAIGIFFECLPDDPALCRNQTFINLNKKRLAFYEHYGAYPIINTLYEQPVNKDDDCAPYLVYDDLGTKRPLSCKELKKIYGAILERKYHEYCPTDYINMVVDSVKEDPVRLRPPRYILKESESDIRTVRKNDLKIQLYVNGKHQIHHIKEIGYVESPVRVKSILLEILKLGITTEVKVREYPEKHIREIHDGGYLNYFRKMCEGLTPGKSVYPYVFPIRNSDQTI